MRLSRTYEVTMASTIATRFQFVCPDCKDKVPFVHFVSTAKLVTLGLRECFVAFWNKIISLRHQFRTEKNNRLFNEMTHRSDFNDVTIQRTSTCLKWWLPVNLGWSVGDVSYTHRASWSRWWFCNKIQEFLKLIGNASKINEFTEFWSN